MDLVNHGKPFVLEHASRWGWNKRTTLEAERQRTVRRLVHGVYVDGRVRDSRNLRFAAIRLIAPDHAVACSETAAWLHGIDAFRPADRHLLEPSFLVSHGASRMRRRGVRCRQAEIDLDDVERLGGVWVTTPERTAIDLLRTLYRPYALAAADAMTHAGLVRQESLIQRAFDLKGFPGIVQARELAIVIDGRAESPGESWMRLRLTDAKLPMPVCQFEVVDHLGRVRILDAAYPESLVGIEFDGREHHTAQADQQHDLERRDFLAQALGWRVVVATRETVFGPSADLERQVAGLLGLTPQLPRLWGTMPVATAA